MGEKINLSVLSVDAMAWLLELVDREARSLKTRIGKTNNRKTKNALRWESTQAEEVAAAL
jgi:hypothetical protein